MNMIDKELLDYWVVVPFNEEQVIFFNTFSKEQLLIKLEKKIETVDQKIFTLKELMEKDEINKLNCIVDRNATVDFIQWADDINRTRELNITVILGYNCNLSCSYCYEREESHKITIGLGDEDNQFENQFVEFVENYISENNIAYVNLEFYGGEPFMYFPKMYYISNTLKQFLVDKDIELYIGIMTNGTLVNKRNIDKLKNLGLYKVEISLDGAKDMHNIRRPLKNCGDAYGTTIMNIADINKIVPVVVRVNVDQQNIDSVKKMLVDLKSIGIHEDISIYFTPVISCNSCCEVEEDLNLIKGIGKLYEFAGKNGYKLAVKYYAIGPCHIYKKNSFGITPEGDIYKCFPMLNTKFGNINLPSDLPSEDLQILKKLNNKCLDCEYLPICFGGCQYANKSEEIDMSCPIEVFKSILPYILKGNTFQQVKL